MSCHLGHLEPFFFVQDIEPFRLFAVFATFSNCFALPHSEDNCRCANRLRINLNPAVQILRVTVQVPPEFARKLSPILSLGVPRRGALKER